MVDDLEGRIEFAAAGVWERMKRVFAVLFLAGWTFGWGFLLLMGYLFTAPTLMAVSGGAIAIGLLAGLVRRMTRRRRLERRAEDELVAKAKLEGVKLDRNIHGVLEAFDACYVQIKSTLEEPELAQETIAVDAAVDLEAVRDRLFHVAETKAKMLREVRKLGRGSGSSVVKASIDDARRAVVARQQEAEQITKDAQRLLSRLEDVRRLSAGPDKAQARGKLEAVLTELDRTAKAYEEIEQAETAEERKLRALRAQQSQKARG